MTDIFTRPEVDRRTLLRRAAAVGLLATPAVSMLSACVGGGSDEPTTQATGAKTDIAFCPGFLRGLAIHDGRDRASDQDLRPIWRQQRRQCRRVSGR